MELTQMLRLFAVILFTCKTMYNKTVISFGFCDIRNNQRRGNIYLGLVLITLFVLFSLKIFLG